MNLRLLKKMICPKLYNYQKSKKISYKKKLQMLREKLTLYLALNLIKNTQNQITQCIKPINDYLRTKMCTKF